MDEERRDLPVLQDRDPIGSAFPVVRTGAPERSRHALSKRVVAALQPLLGKRPAGLQESARITVKLRDHELSVRGLAAYLGFIDRVYGRSVYGTLDRYRRSRAELEIVEVRRGSVVLVIREALHAMASPEGIALTALALKFLPDVIKAPAAAYRDYEEARFRRAERKRLLQRASVTDDLKDIGPKELGFIIGAVLDAYEREHARLTGAQDFAVKQVQDVTLDIGDTSAGSDRADNRDRVTKRSEKRRSRGKDDRKR